MKKINASARRKARRLVLQGLYQWQLSQNNINEIEAQLLIDINERKIDITYFKELIHAIPSKLSEIDEAMQSCLDRPLSELNPVELAILRMSIYELIHRLEIPYKVIINEALELTKTFGAEEGHKYVNGVLDNLAKKLRKQEVMINHK